MMMMLLKRAKCYKLSFDSVYCSTFTQPASQQLHEAGNSKDFNRSEFYQSFHNRLSIHEGEFIEFPAENYPSKRN